MSSDSDSSDSTPAITGLWGADAYFSDAEEAQNEYVPLSKRPSRRREQWYRRAQDRQAMNKIVAETSTILGSVEPKAFLEKVLVTRSRMLS